MEGPRGLGRNRSKSGGAAGQKPPSSIGPMHNAIKSNQEKKNNKKRYGCIEGVCNLREKEGEYGAVGMVAGEGGGRTEKGLAKEKKKKKKKKRNERRGQKKKKAVNAGKRPDVDRG